MSYVKNNPILSTDFTSFAGQIGTSAGSSAAATAKAGYLLGVGYGDRGYGEISPALGTPPSIIASTDWLNLQTVMSTLASWQATSTALVPPSSLVSASTIVRAHNSASPSLDPYDIAQALTLLDNNRLNFVVGNMTAISSAATTTRATTWGSGSTGITCEFSITFASEDAARYFFNTGGELRISLSHPNTSTPRNSSWNSVLNGFVCALRANTTARTGGTKGTAQAIGYYNLTTAYQVIIDGTNSGVSPYTVNDFFVDAKATSIVGLNGAKGSVLNIRVRLIDEQTNAFSDSVAAGTVATLGHLRGTSGPLTAKAAPTCSVITAF